MHQGENYIKSNTDVSIIYRSYLRCRIAAKLWRRTSSISSSSSELAEITAYSDLQCSRLSKFSNLHAFVVFTKLSVTLRFCSCSITNKKNFVLSQLVCTQKMPTFSELNLSKMKAKTSNQIFEKHFKSTSKSYGTYAHLFHFNECPKYSKLSNA